MNSANFRPAVVGMVNISSKTAGIASKIPAAIRAVFSIVETFGLRANSLRLFE